MKALVLQHKVEVAECLTDRESLDSYVQLLKENPKDSLHELVQMIGEGIDAGITEYHDMTS